MTTSVVISGTGLWTPSHKITNEELVEAYNGYAEKFNADNRTDIEIGELTAKPLSSAEFIEKASGIRSRYTYIKDGILDITRMRPNIPKRADDELSDQAEMAMRKKRYLRPIKLQPILMR